MRSHAFVVALAAGMIAAPGFASADDRPGRPGARPAPPPVVAQRHAPAPRVHASPRVYWYVPIPWYDPWPYHSWRYYPDPWYPYPYPPRVVTVPSAPPVYIERESGEQTPPPGYWYWCDDPQGYYPTVRECPGGWTQVPPRPAGTQ